MTLKWRLGTEENHLTPFGCVCALLVGILIYLVLVLPNDAVPHSQSDIRSQQQSGQP